MKLIENAIFFGFGIWVILETWQQMELAIYGEIQVRKVDTFVTILWMFLLLCAYLKGYVDGQASNKNKKEE